MSESFNQASINAWIAEKKRKSDEVAAATGNPPEYQDIQPSDPWAEQKRKHEKAMAELALGIKTPDQMGGIFSKGPGPAVEGSKGKSPDSIDTRSTLPPLDKIMGYDPNKK